MHGTAIQRKKKTKNYEPATESDAKVTAVTITHLCAADGWLEVRNLQND